MFCGTRSINMRNLVLNLREEVASGNLALNDIESHPRRIAAAGLQNWHTSRAKPGCSTRQLLQDVELLVRTTPDRRCSTGISLRFGRHPDHRPVVSRRITTTILGMKSGHFNTPFKTRLRSNGAAGDWSPLAVIRRSWGRGFEQERSHVRIDQIFRSPEL
ncbi:hypothetical protein CI238_12547 [Colletotrichum incanum]|uniref:Uncharacterized protein n=1 Tax=Colletotrichum incanum TaxID=1573173 RepID=A0A167D2E4_COLIC|nr:hypothetical protein CI238_12547 [Colletotrichum incanum]